PAGARAARARVGARSRVASLLAAWEDPCWRKVMLHTVILILSLQNPFERGEELRSMGRLREALVAYQEATLVLSDPAPAYRNAAMLELAFGDRELARIDYSRYLRLRPSAEDAAQVRAVLSELERISTVIPQGSCASGDHQFDEGKIDQAVGTFETCLHERPH